MTILFFCVLYVYIFYASVCVAKNVYYAPFNVAIVITVHDRTTYIEHVISGWSRCWFANETALILAVDGHPLGSFYSDIHDRFKSRFASFIIHYLDVHDRLHNGENVKKAWLASLVFGLSFAPHDDTIIIKTEDDWYPTKDAILVAKHMLPMQCPKCAFVNIGNWIQFDDVPKGDLGRYEFVEEILHNFGMCWTRSNFRRYFLPSIDFFATFADHNWDWTLSAMISRGVLLPHTIRPKMSRLIHLGKCGGTHYQSVSDQETCRMDMIKDITSLENLEVGDDSLASIVDDRLRRQTLIHIKGSGLSFVGPDSVSVPNRGNNPAVLINIYKSIINRLVPAHIGYQLSDQECLDCNRATSDLIYDAQSLTCRGYIDCRVCVRLECLTGYSFQNGKCSDIINNEC